MNAGGRATKWHKSTSICVITKQVDVSHNKKLLFGPGPPAVRCAGKYTLALRASLSEPVRVVQWIDCRIDLCRRANDGHYLATLMDTFSFQAPPRS